MSVDLPADKVKGGKGKEWKRELSGTRKNPLRAGERRGSRREKGGPRAGENLGKRDGAGQRKGSKSKEDNERKTPIEMKGNEHERYIAELGGSVVRSQKQGKI